MNEIKITIETIGLAEEATSCVEITMQETTEDNFKTNAKFRPMVQGVEMEELYRQYPGYNAVIAIAMHILEM